MPFLHRLYRAAGLLSAAAMVLICALIVAQIVARNLGSTVPDADEFAAWAMAASGFLGLPYALHAGSHIRVAVVMRFVSAGVQHAMEVLATLLGLAIAGYLAWYSAAFVHESFTFKEVSQGLVAVPLWIPQLPMAVGAVLLTVAFAERLLVVLRRGTFETGAGGDEKSE